VSIGRDDVFYEVLFLCLMSGDAYAAALLHAVFVNAHALDIAVVGDGYDEVFLVDEVFYVYIAVIVRQLASSGIVVLILYFEKLCLDDIDDSLRSFEYVLKIGDLFVEFVQFFLQFVYRQLVESVQSHIENGVDLLFGKFESLHKSLRAGRSVGRLADYSYYFVDICLRDHETLDDMLSFERLIEVVPGTAHDDGFLMLYVLFEYLFEVEYLGRAVYERKHYHRVGDLKLSVLVKKIENYLRVELLLYLDDYSHTLAV